MFNSAIKLKENLDAIKIVLQKRDKYSVSDIEIIRKFNGWGGLKSCLLDPYNDSDWVSASKVDVQLRDKFKELHSVLQDELTGKQYKLAVDGMKNGILSQFYTPSVIPHTFYSVLKQFTTVSKLYDPSAGMGIFIDEALDSFESVQVTAYEKDYLTGLLLQASCESVSVGVNIKGFEESNSNEDGQYDLVCSNPPYGAYGVFDSTIDEQICKKIHNYYFAKGLEKLKDKAILGFLVTSAFLDTVTNKSAREYVFNRVDFISLAIMPDNLMVDTANTWAPSHFLVVRKNDSKEELSEEEKLLIESSYLEGGIAMNKYIQKYEDDCIIATGKSIGKNQYGKPGREVHWSGDINGISNKFSRILERDFSQRYQRTEEEILKAFSEMHVAGDSVAKIVDNCDKKELKGTLEGFVKEHIIVGSIPPWEEKWESSDRYLAGNVYQKMLVAESVYREKGGEQIKRSLDAIIEIQPDKIPMELLIDHFNLGERWIDIETYNKFAKWIFEVDRVKVVYLPGTDTFKVEIGYSRVSQTDYRVGSKGRTTLYGSDLLQHALENTVPYITYYDWQTKQNIADNDAIQMANEKIEMIRAKFTEWLGTISEDERNQLVETYNNLYNCYVLRKYDGSHLRLPDIDMESLATMGVTEIRDAQKDVAWRIIQDNGAIVDWEVGSGKSLCIVIAAHEMKRMGIRRKPCILCLKANVGDIARTYRLAYPHAMVLAPTEQDFQKQNRKRLFHEMKNNDWDCVIMTHDQFGRIPQSADIQMEILGEEVANLDRDLQVLADTSLGWNTSKQIRKGLEGRKSNLMVKLKTIRQKIEDNKDEDIDFEQMGIDHLFIDESHRFKSLTFTTRHERVAGLGNPTGSQKALNMLFAIRTLQKRFNADLQATFLSGTPISNSLTEMYLLFKYLRPKELARQNILNFDAWAAVYAKKTTDYEFGVTNQIKAKERFRHFIKVPELAMFYNEIADYRTNKSINIDKPEMVEELIHMPPTPDQKDFITKLIKYAETGNGNYIGRPDLEPGSPKDSARMLIATNYAKKMSTDMRLINSELYDDHPDNKVSRCCVSVAENYHKFNEHLGVQLIFCDLGVPQKNTWNVYQAIKDKLVEEYELPADEIKFIHDYDERTRGKLFKQVNDGIVRILIGSTDKAGTGVNVQQRIVTIHDLDIPWKPAELEQRGGRGARQGNWVAKLHQNNIVYRYIYAVEQSLDTYKFTLLKNKQLFISQMKTNELHVRSIDEGSIDEESGMNFAEYVAVLSGDTTLLEKAKIDKKLTVLENLRNAHYREQSSNKTILEHKEKRIVYVDEAVGTLVRDFELYSTQLKRDDTGVKLNPIEIPVLVDTLRKLDIERESAELSKVLEKQARKAARMYGVKVGKVGDVETVIDAETGEEVEELITDKKKKKNEIKDSATVVGEYIISLWKNWVPKPGEVNEKIGTLYGFNLYIERQTNQGYKVYSYTGKQ